MSLIGGLIQKGAEGLVGALGKAIDSTFTNDEERLAKQADLDKIKAVVQAEANRHLEAMEVSLTHQLELQMQENESARHREIELVKATGRHDYFMWFIGGSAVAIFGGVTVFLLSRPIPSGNEHIVINLIGILEGAVLTIYGYYYSSSLGSRIKDTVKK